MEWNGAKVKDLRLRLGWCTANLARRLECTQELVMTWESGGDEPDSQYFSTLKYLFDSAEAYADKMQQNILAESILKEKRLEQITRDEIFRLTEEY